MPFGGLVVNRLHGAPVGDVPEELGGALGGRVAAAMEDLNALAAREQANLELLRSELGEVAAVVPELDDDVHDIDGLERMREYLFDAA
jgi:hypothetical protein